MGMTPVFWLSLVTAGFFAWLAYRGTGRWTPMVLTGVLTLGLILVVPLIVITFAAHWGGFSAHRAIDEAGANYIILGNVVAWGWILWRRYA